MRLVLCAVTACSFIVACSASETDFKKAAEEAAVESAEENNPGFTAEAECAEPSSTDVGTTFSCTITFDDGDVVTVTAEIISDDTVRIAQD